MTFYAFRLLSPVMQLYWVLHHGTCLADRREGEFDIGLYQVADDGRGFFVEVELSDDKQRPPRVRRSFVNAGPLEDYTQGVGLPEG